MANGQLPVPPPPSLAQAKCLVCQGDFLVHVPSPRIINGPDFSNIVFVHAQFDKCPGCGTEYNFRVRGIDQNGTLGFDWVPIETQKSAIVPGTDSNLKQAVNNEEVVKKIKIN